MLVGKDSLAQPRRHRQPPGMANGVVRGGGLSHSHTTAACTFRVYSPRAPLTSLTVPSPRARHRHPPSYDNIITSSAFVHPLLKLPQYPAQRPDLLEYSPSGPASAVFATQPHCTLPSPPRSSPVMLPPVSSCMSLGSMPLVRLAVHCRRTATKFTHAKFVRSCSGPSPYPICFMAGPDLSPDRARSAVGTWLIGANQVAWAARARVVGTAVGSKPRPRIGPSQRLAAAKANWLCAACAPGMGRTSLALTH